MKEPVALAVDLGGTWLRAAGVDAARTVMHEYVVSVGERRGTEQVRAILREAVGHVRECLRSSGRRIAVAGLSVPGLVDSERGLIRFAANLGVSDLPVADLVQGLLGAPVIVENDVRAATWGEWRWGAGEGADPFVYLNAGTGIAVGLMWGGRLLRGVGGAAGEIGHMPVVADGDPCRCGGRGCLETVAGGWGIAARAVRLAAAAGMPLPEGAAAREVCEVAARGHPVAAQVVRDAGDALGRAAIMLTRLVNPERIVLGGGLFAPGSPLVEAVRQCVEAHPLRDVPPPEVVVGRLGIRAGLLGAACLALEMLAA